MADWQGLGKPWERERNAMLKSGQQNDAFLDEFRWLLEELRVALFAQELKDIFAGLGKAAAEDVG
jgi:ATP-dependent helicase HrpA